MTRDEILNMKAGREMDALIAIKVMGWEWKPVGDRFINHERLTHPDGKHYGGMRYSDGEIEYTNRLEEYSTNMGAAWEVVEAMEGKWFWFSLSNVVPNSGDAIVYEAKFNQVYTCEETAPLAICRAALLAVVEGVKE